MEHPSVRIFEGKNARGQPEKVNHYTNNTLEAADNAM